MFDFVLLASEEEISTSEGDLLPINKQHSFLHLSLLNSLDKLVFHIIKDVHCMADKSLKVEYRISMPEKPNDSI